MTIEQDIGAYGLVELANRIIDKSIATDAWIKASLVGIELLAVEARVVCTGIETFLKYDKTVNLSPVPFAT
ncbi:MAG: gas vesicle synthesis protein GvpA [candidate division Zixibacteria bacterium 4484_95]|nr:MAG: gas vesicle synthesis protein GvpA [candidate division Zixibacteria bacterium 4484_95]